MSQLVPIAQMPLRARHWYIFAVASLEQLIGAALSTIVGVIIPLILLLGSPHLSATDQGILGASGLIGIAVGSVIIGKLMDSMGYLLWFRLSALIIAAGAAGVYFSDSFWPLAAFLFCIGLGVGGGYSLDSGYISEIMPSRWESFFVGLAKATSSVGFVGGAAYAYIFLKADPSAAAWPDLILFVGALGVLAFLLRIRWYQSPRWLMARGETAKAQQAARDFLGPDAEVLPLPAKDAGAAVTWGEMFRGENLEKVIFSGVSWACEMEIYDPASQDTHAGGSGCGCSAVTLSAYILKNLEQKNWNRVLFVPTGALLSKTSFNEGQTVPGIAHGVVIEAIS